MYMCIHDETKQLLCTSIIQDGFCHTDEALCGARISEWYNTPEGNVSALVEAIYMHGPISVAIDASHLSFAFYSNGVYYEPKCGEYNDTQMMHNKKAVDKVVFHHPACLCMYLS